MGARRHERLQTLLEPERGLWSRGLTVAGLDEAGAGPLAGPVAAACVVLHPERVAALVGVDDSKRLSPSARERCAEAIRKHALAFAVAWASVEEIDSLNIREASLLAMQRALNEVRGREEVRIDHLLVDARELRDDLPQTSLVHGDAISVSIAAASILAKVTRDAWMVEADARYPGYGLASHKGYGTRAHVEAIHALGVLPIHRRSFEPIRSLVSAAPRLG